MTELDYTIWETSELEVYYSELDKELLDVVTRRHIVLDELCRRKTQELETFG